MRHQEELGNPGAHLFQGAGHGQLGHRQNHPAPARQEKIGWSFGNIFGCGGSERGQADEIMKDFYQQFDKTDLRIKDQGQRITILENATASLLESQADSQKRVQVLAEGITKQEAFQEEYARKVYAPLQFNTPR